MRVQYSLSFALLASLGLAGQSSNWIAAGDLALYEGHPAEAAADYSRALEMHVQAGAPDADLLHLRVYLVTAYLESGDIRGAEGVLRQVDDGGVTIEDGRSRAEVLNAWAAVHTFQGKWNETERELDEARGILLHTPEPGDLLPSVLHNLAAIEMRTGAYAQALINERGALERWGNAPNQDIRHLVKGWAALGAVQYLVGQPREAHRSLERAIATARKTYGPSHPLLAALLESDAVILDRLKLKKEAKLAQGEAQQIRGGRPAAGSERTTWNVREGLAPDSAVYLRSK